MLPSFQNHQEHSSFYLEVLSLSEGGFSLRFWDSWRDQLVLSTIRKCREAKAMFLFVKVHPRKVFQTSRLTFHCRNLVLGPHLALRGSRRRTFQSRHVWSSGGLYCLRRTVHRFGDEGRALSWEAIVSAEQNRAWSDSQEWRLTTLCGGRNMPGSKQGARKEVYSSDPNCIRSPSW